MSLRIFLLTVTVAGLVAAAIYPLAHRQIERRHQTNRLDQLVGRVDDITQVNGIDLATRLDRLEPVLASWQDVGGCGVGGGPSAGGGGVKWVGRSVTGGLVGFECITSTAVTDDSQSLTMNFRPSTELFNKWIIGANAPFNLKFHDVDVYGEQKKAMLPGWGDVSFDVTYKLGLTNASRITASLTTPTGSYDAVREGVVLPQQAQLGSGQFATAITFEHTIDKMWGMILVGGNLATPIAGRTGPSTDFTANPEKAETGANSIGDYRASSASAYAYVGYLWGPFVPHAGFTLNGKYEKDRERWEVIEDQSLINGTFHLGIEWASDYVAILLAGNTSLSIQNGLESWTLAICATTSVF